VATNTAAGPTSKSYKEAQEKGALERGESRLTKPPRHRFHAESHNQPSAVEPFQSAATGVGGILKYFFNDGARPIANLNSLRFGPLTNSCNRFLFEHVVAAFPTSPAPPTAGRDHFHPCYTGNPLVNAMAVGVVESTALPAPRLPRATL